MMDLNTYDEEEAGPSESSTEPELPETPKSASLETNSEGFSKKIEFSKDNVKNILQHFWHSLYDSSSTPTYECKYEGPDHSRVFRAEVKLPYLSKLKNVAVNLNLVKKLGYEEPLVGRGKGANKKEAEKEAAYDVCTKLASLNLLSVPPSLQLQSAKTTSTTKKKATGPKAKLSPAMDSTKQKRHVPDTQELVQADEKRTKGKMAKVDRQTEKKSPRPKAKNSAPPVPNWTPLGQGPPVVPADNLPPITTHTPPLATAPPPDRSSNDILQQVRLLHPCLIHEALFQI
jgi:hypothetical protein